MKRKGSITVEAAIIMPIYILLLAFLINFLSIFYIKLVVQGGLNSAATTIAQYCYAVDLTLGMENFTLSEETSQKADALADSIEQFSSSSRDMASVFDKTFSFDTVPELIKKGVDFAKSAKSLGTKLRGINGADVKNYLLTSATESGGGLIVQEMVENYIDEMKINRNLIDGPIQYDLYIMKENTDLVLTACYQYHDSMFSAFTDKPFVIKQQIVVHPWIGGNTDGLRKK